MRREAAIVARIDEDFKMPSSFGEAKAERDTVATWYAGALSSKLEADRQKAATEATAATEAAAAAAAAAAAVNVGPKESSQDVVEKSLNEGIPRKFFFDTIWLLRC